MYVLRRLDSIYTLIYRMDESLFGVVYLLLIAFLFRLFLELVIRRLWASRTIQRPILSRLEFRVSISDFIKGGVDFLHEKHGHGEYERTRDLPKISRRLGC
jgi:hypothetical protein